MKPDYDLIIIGAGFGGIGLGLKLKEENKTRFAILEAESGIGGTWWLNRYPGCACDVQSHLYSLSFAPNPDWSRHFPSRTEIQQHLEKTARESGLSEHIELNTRVEQAQWDESLSVWHVTDSSGRTRTARNLVGATGGLARPAWPDIKGMETFKGRLIHSQHWPDDLNIEDQHVAVIGTGASAVQFVPHLAAKAKTLSVFQRTPNWILPKPDRAISPTLKKLFRQFPPFRLLWRLALFTLLETRLPAFTRYPFLSAVHRRKARRHLRAQVNDPELVEKLTPNYPMGCKRVLMSNDYYPVFNEPHTHLVTERIERITPEGIIDQSGHLHVADIIVLGTGFQATSPLPENFIIGKHGQDLAKMWAEGPEAHKGISVHGFPNFFLMLGPNTALGHNSVLLMIEGQIRYILSALSQQAKHGWRRMEVQQASQEAWNRKLSTTLGRSVWSSGGCQSWYLHPVSGKNTTLWPHTTIYYKRLTAALDPAEYACE